VIMAELASTMDGTWLSRPFWEAVARDELVLPHCPGCDCCFFRPEEACPRCLSTDWQWVPSPGRGTLHSFTTVHRPPFPGMPAPFLLGVTLLDEGVHLLTRVFAPPGADLEFDQRMTLVLDDTSGRKLPAFAGVTEA
jgi:uncharacterized protein